MNGEQKGFSVNTEINFKKKLTKKERIKRRNIFVLSCAVVIILILGTVFCATVPIINKQRVESCTEKSSSGQSYKKTFYNDNGDKVKEEEWSNDFLRGEVVYTYNEKGKLSQIDTNYGGQPFSKIIYTYEEDRLLSVTEYALSGAVIREDLYEDTTGDKINDIKRRYEGVDKKIVTETALVYDGNNLIKETETTVAGGYVETTDYVYEGGNLVKEVVNSDRVTDRTTEYIYNEKGLLTNKKNDTGSYFTYSYTFKNYKVTVFER